MAAPDLPTAIGPFRVVRELGRGGMGTVYLAEDTALHRRVALKVMAAKWTTRPDAKERFLREARAMSAVKHDHVCTVYHVGEADGTAYLAMEYLEGSPLNKWLAKNPPPKVGVAVRLAKEVARGLAAAHAKGLVHRDIKPGNVWLEAPKGRVKLLDFGLACDPDTEPAVGTTVGTPAFMAPEQARGDAVDAKADLWSLGVVLFRMLTGRQPFEVANRAAMLTALATEPVPSIGLLAPNAPPALADLVMRLLAKSPADRPASAAAVADELQAVERALTAAGSRTDATPVPPPKRNRTWPVVGGVVAGLLALGGVAGFALRPGPKPPAERVEPPPQSVAVAPPATVAPPTVAALPKLTDEWLARVRSLAADDQAREVAAEIARRNSGFANAPRFDTKDGRIVGFVLDGGQALRDLSPVAALPFLTTFRVVMPAAAGERGPWADLSPLKTARLTTLDLRNCPVADLSPLAGQPLETVTLLATRVENLSAVANPALKAVSLFGSPVRDVGPLTNTPLGSLDCTGTPVADLAPVAGTPLQHLKCDADLARRSGGVFKQMASLQSVNGTDWRLAERFAAVPELPAAGTLTGHIGPVKRLAFAPAGTLLASGGADGVAVVWDAAARTERQRETVTRSSVIDLGWLDATTVLAFGDGPLYRIAVGGPAVNLPTGWKAGEATAFAFQPADKTVLVASKTPNGRQAILRRYPLMGTAPISGVALVPNDAFTDVASAGDERCAALMASGAVRLWEQLRNGRPPRTVATGGATAIAFTPDGRLLLARDGTLAVFADADVPELTVKLPYPARGLATTGGGVIVVGDGDGYLLDAATLEPQHRLAGAGKAGCVAASVAGTSVAVGGDDGTVRLWTAPESPMPSPEDGPLDPAWVTRVASLPADDQTREVTAAVARRNPGYLRRPQFTVRAGTVVGVEIIGTRQLRDLAPLAALTALESFRCTMPLPESDKGPWADLSPLAGKPLTTVDVRTTRVTDVGPILCRTLETLDCPPQASNAIQRQSAQLPALKTVNGRPMPRPTVPDIPALTPGRALMDHTTGTRRVAFSPDGRLLVSGGVDGVVIVTDVATGVKRHQFGGNTAAVAALGWLDNVTFLVAIDGVRPTIYSATSGKPMGTLPLSQNLEFGTLTLTSDRRTLLVANESVNTVPSAVLRLAVQTRANLTPLAGLTDAAERIAVRGDSRHVAVASNTEVRVYDGQSARLLHRLPSGRATLLAFTSAGRLIVGDRGRLQMYTDTYKTPLTVTTPHANAVAAVAVAGNRVVVVGDGPDATLHDGTTLAVQVRLPGGSGGADVAASPDGKFVAVANTGRGVTLWPIPAAK